MPNEQVLRHFREPKNVGELPPPAIRAEVMNPVCGDILRLTARIKDGAVAEIAFKARGCVASIAAGSALTELIHGRTRPQLEALAAADIDNALNGLEPESKHAAALCIDAVKGLLTHWC